jgi:DNA-binding GntR family transcriptional regulator
VLRRGAHHPHADERRHRRCGGRTEDFGEWKRAHRDFHRVLVGGAGEQVVQLIEMQAERAERYLRFYQLRDSASWWRRNTEAEHRDLLDTIARDRGIGTRHSVGAIGRHLARTALLVIAEAEPERDLHPIRLALQMALSVLEEDSASAPSPAADTLRGQDIGY